MGSPQASLALPGPSWPTLPVFPHPASLFAGAGNPFVVADASSATAALDKLKDDLRSGTFDLSLPPPAADRPILAPLPPVPVAPVSVSRKRSSIAVGDAASKPLSVPPLPKALRRDVGVSEALESWTASLAKGSAAAGAGVGEEGQKDNELSAVSTAPTGQFAITATLNPRRNAILFSLGGPSRSHGAAWAVLKTVRDDGSREDLSSALRVRISQIKLFSPSECRSQPPLLHAESKDPAYRNLGTSLSALHLTLPDLLFRLPHVPALLASACYHCGKRIVSPDGLPAQGSGFLPYASKRKRKTGRDRVKSEKGDGKKESVGDKEDTSTQDEEEEAGRWVCWHASCEP